MSIREAKKRRFMVALAAAAASAAISFAGLLIRNRLRQRREVTRREEQLDEAIWETMDASDAVARY